MEQIPNNPLQQMSKITTLRTLWFVVSFSEVRLLFSCLKFFCGPTTRAPRSSGPQFIEPPEPPVSTPLFTQQENYCIEWLNIYEVTLSCCSA